MDTNKEKNTPIIKQWLNTFKNKKNLFITRIKILKQLKENGNDVNIETIKKVFNIKSTNKKNTNFTEYKIYSDTNDINTKKNKKTKKNNYKSKDKNKNRDKDKNNSNILDLKNNHALIISLLCILNIGISLLSFNFLSNTNFNNMSEQFTEIIARSIKSPQTEIYLKSKIEDDNGPIIYYYEIVDNLDSYTYKIKNTDIKDELRVKLLENISLKTKEIKNLDKINPTEYNSITLVGDYYIINNKYKIKETSLNGKDINSITQNIKYNSINNYNKNKIEFIISTFATLAILEGFAILYLNNRDKKNT